MPDISIKRRHALGLKGAKAAADKMADKLGEKFDLQGDWQGNTMRFARPGVSGVLSIGEAEMTLEVTLGFMLKMMRGPIEEAVHQQLDQVLTAAAPAAPKTSGAAKASKATRSTATQDAAAKPASRRK